MNNKPSIYILFSRVTHFLPWPNTALLATCDFWRENITRKHNQLISDCRALLNTVKYIGCDKHSIQTRHNVIHWCYLSSSSFKYKKRMLLSTGATVAQYVGQTVKSSIQQPGALLKQLL